MDLIECCFWSRSGVRVGCKSVGGEVIVWDSNINSHCGNGISGSGFEARGFEIDSHICWTAIAVSWDKVLGFTFNIMLGVGDACKGGKVVVYLIDRVSNGV